VGCRRHGKIRADGVRQETLLESLLGDIETDRVAIRTYIEKNAAFPRFTHPGQNLAASVQDAVLKTMKTMRKYIAFAHQFHQVRREVGRVHGVHH